MATKGELEGFLADLKKYQADRGDDELRESLIRRSAALRRIIAPPNGNIIITGALGSPPFEAFENAFNPSVNSPDVNRALTTIIVKTNEAIGRIESGVDEGVGIKMSEPPKAFIAHGGETVALRRLGAFLDALGVHPLIAEEQPSEGRDVDEQVNRYIELADCGIILATFGNIEDSLRGKQHPRLNVIDELARLRERMPNRVILLLEEEVDLPTNVSGIVYERFKQDNMEQAFIKVAKELKAFGIIQAVKPGSS